MSEIFGITGWKNSGKTTMVARLVEEFTRRGLIVSTIKHASAAFEIDHAGTDSFVHREAGAREVAIVSDDKWAIIHKADTPSAAPTLDTMLNKLGPCDLVLVEGFKSSKIDKIECVLTAKASKDPLWQSNKSVVAVASDQAIEGCYLPQFNIDDVQEIADYIAQITGLGLS